MLPCVLAAMTSARGTPAPGSAGAAEQPARADTLRGTIEVVGSEPATLVALMVDGGRRAVALEGPRPLLDRLAGLEVAVWGAPLRAGVFRVERVEVRASAGVPAVDGVLARQGRGWVLVTHDGRRLPVAHLPEVLQRMEGARVWLAGPLDRDPDSSGVISEPPS